jgi:hypothetical protein
MLCELFFAKKNELLNWDDLFEKHTFNHSHLIDALMSVSKSLIQAHLNAFVS